MHFVPVILGCLFFVLPSFAEEFPALNVLKPKFSSSVQQTAAQGLVQRVIGNRASDFIIVVDPALSKDGDAFQIENSGSQIKITGTTGVAASAGFYYYLKNFCDAQYTWGGQNINLPSTLPPVSKPVLIKILDKFRYYQNVCTVSYSLPFWNWTKWERHLDWMAMNAINLPLAFTGQEAIFQRLYRNMGFTDDDLNAFFGGPAFLAWSRMGNIRGWGGPLSQTWITRKLVLQHQILQRMREFGMIPVLPGFAGHVPAAITRVMPNAKVSRLGSWGNFNSTYSETYLLDFNDPLFVTLGSKFIQLMKSEFGVDHIYNADTFNEMKPKSNTTEYLQSAGGAVFKAMEGGDPDAIWLMQGWLFLNGFWGNTQVDALVNSVPKGRMVILDLMSEDQPQYIRSKSYFGQPFIWCMLHNFGGTMELFGQIESVNTGPTFGRKLENSTMIGTGITMEGIHQNEVMYEFMLESTYRGPVNLTSWMSMYAKRRYGFTSPDIDQAWQYLKKSVYNCTNGHQDFDFVLITRRPTYVSLCDSSVYNCTNHHHDNDMALITNRPGLKAYSDYWYNPEDLFKAWDFIVKGADQFTPNELFLYDLVDVTRNCLQDVAPMYFKNMTNAIFLGEIDKLIAAGKKFMEVINDMETLLASDRHFLLGTWVADAVQWGANFTETFQMQYNARNQITDWGPDGQISDYASKQWSGVFKNYYVPRWQFFIDYMVQVIKNGTKFNNGVFRKRILEEVEKPFFISLDLPPTSPTGNTVDIVKKLYAKYRPVTKEDFFHQAAKNAMLKRQAQNGHRSNVMSFGHNAYSRALHKDDHTLYFE